MAVHDDAGDEAGDDRDARRDERDRGVDIQPSEKSPNIASNLLAARGLPAAKRR